MRAATAAIIFEPLQAQHRYGLSYAKSRAVARLF